MKIRGVMIQTKTMAALCVGFVAFFLLPSCDKSVQPVEAAELYVRDVSEGIHNITPVRGERGPLMLRRDGDEYECSLCHFEGFEGDLGEAALEGEHADITFEHGSNRMCLNCHNKENADMYVAALDGSEIGGDEPTRLCTKCHGLRFKEWDVGVHGRTNGTWKTDPDVEGYKKLDCIQCHDPHQPSFKPMKPERPSVLNRFDRASSDSQQEHD